MKVGWMIILLFPPYLFSQKRSCSCVFRSIASVGMVAGESGVKPLVQVNGGITYGRYFTGVGVGFDSYRFNTMPFFADWRMSLGKKNALFVYGNGGYNFPIADNDEDQNAFKTRDKLKGGLYFDAGVGYRINVSGSHHISFSAGYNQKNIVWTKGYVYPCTVPPCTEEIFRYSYQLGRLVTKLSWELDWKK